MKIIIFFLGLTVILILIVYHYLREAFVRKEKLNLLLNNMLEGVCFSQIIYDKIGNPIDYRFLEVNSAFEKLTGLKRKEVIGKTITEILPKSEKYWIDNFREVGATQKPIHFHNFHQEIGKHYEYYAFSSSKDKFTVVFSDITKQKNAVEELDKYQKLKFGLTNHIIISLTNLLEIHDCYTKNHSENVANLSKKLAENLNLSEEMIDRVYYAGLVHDIGKTIISKKILTKKDPLSEAEFNDIKKHPVIGFMSLNTSPDLKRIAKIVLYHHEKWNGKGYPHRLKGNEIPLESRIISLVDAYDAMISNRPYRKALSDDYVINEIKAQSGHQFDPHITKFFLDIIS